MPLNKIRGYEKKNRPDRKFVRFEVPVIDILQMIIHIFFGN